MRLIIANGHSQVPPSPPKILNASFIERVCSPKLSTWPIRSLKICVVAFESMVVLQSQGFHDYFASHCFSIASHSVCGLSVRFLNPFSESTTVITDQSYRCCDIGIIQ